MRIGLMFCALIMIVGCTSPQPQTMRSLNDVVSPEGWNGSRITRNGVIVSEFWDTNGSGATNFWRYMDDQGRVIREMEDRTGDGFQDVIRHYRNGLIVMQEEDTNGDRVMDLFTMFERGVPVKRSVGHGKPAQWVSISKPTHPGSTNDVPVDNRPNTGYALQPGEVLNPAPVQNHLYYEETFNTIIYPAENDPYIQFLPPVPVENNTYTQFLPPVPIESTTLTPERSNSNALFDQIRRDHPSENLED